MAGKKVLIIYAHQEPRSFNGSLKKVAVDELHKQGCTVTVSDLYAMDFEPRATRKDITAWCIALLWI
ncbi:N-ribosyldihydronicotinamide:quinone reductase 2 [Phyllostomus discolor]|uniref:N-ribosyldihydronicotinamide:quinone reductase 2 n=1 Tax=Phyllostomus discolor TaxID=89673 RepID=A0A834EAX7_9CHIR|nr:N-ribosyldihydronicotinamide:quinone reductase 2 [Phyllostomus discolor]